MTLERKTRLSIADLLVVTLAVAFAIVSCAAYGAATIFLPAVIFILAPWLALRNNGSSRAYFAAFAVASLLFTFCSVRQTDNYVNYLVWDCLDPVGRFSGFAYDLVELGSVFAPAVLYGIFACVIGHIGGCLGQSIYRRYCDRLTETPDTAAT